jgi:hypothetical protein
MPNAECVRAIFAAGHRKKKAFTGKIIDIVTKFHLDHALRNGCGSG